LAGASPAGDDPAVLPPRRRLLCAGVAGALALAAAPAHAAFPGTNGRIAYQGFQNLGTVNAGGGQRTPLISGGPAQIFAAPAWSADGQRLAFSSNRDGSDFEIYVASADGRTVAPITSNTAEDDNPTWSPDGGRIAFDTDRDGLSKVYIMAGNGTGAFQAAPAPGVEDWTPAWSPDGSRIAFARGPDGNRDIWLMNGDGGGAVQLTSGGGDELFPDWSPDGTRIVFQRTGAGLATVAAGNGADRRPLPVPVDARAPAWSPDGTKIVYDVRPELFVVNANGTGAPSPLTTGGSSTLLSQAPNWQPIPRPATPPPGGPGGGPTDADGDGVSTPTDCNDADAAVKPGARDTPGDGVDQNCDGRDGRIPVVNRRIAGFWATFAGPYTKFTALTVKPVRKGDRIKLTCKGPGCKGKGKSVRVKKGGRKLSMLAHLKGAKLRKGAQVRLRVTRPGAIGRVHTWTIRAPKAPKLVRRCAQPGSRKLSRCP
jgi:hypothetical protein